MLDVGVFIVDDFSVKYDFVVNDVAVEFVVK